MTATAAAVSAIAKQSQRYRQSDKIPMSTDLT